MKKGASFDQVWLEQPELAFAPRPKQTVCAYARHFTQWGETTISATLTKANLVAINQAKLQLVDKYFEWRAYVPKAHRNHAGERGHFCIYHTFERFYRMLRLAELAQTGPLLFLPPPPPPAPPPVPGVALGEIVGEE